MHEKLRRIGAETLSISSNPGKEDCFTPFYPGGLLNPPGLGEQDPLYSAKEDTQRKLWLEETVEEIFSNFPAAQAMAMRLKFGIGGPQLGIRKIARSLMGHGYIEGPMGKNAIQFARGLVDSGIKQIKETQGARLEVFYK